MVLEPAASVPPSSPCWKCRILGPSPDLLHQTRCDKIGKRFTRALKFGHIIARKTENQRTVGLAECPFLHTEVSQFLGGGPKHQGKNMYLVMGTLTSSF